MKLNEKLKFHFNGDYSGNNFQWKYYQDWYGVASFINPTITVNKYNWACKGCGVKIQDDVQIESKELRNPVYHVKCYKFIAKKVLEELQENEKEMYAQIDNIPNEELYEPMLPDENNNYDL